MVAEPIFIPAGATYFAALLGAWLATYNATIVEAKKRDQQASDVARILYQELCFRVARCCFDFEAPWLNYLREPGKAANSMPATRLLKFTPDSALIYSASSDKLALLPVDAAQALIQFYFSLFAWGRDIANFAQDAKEIPSGVRTADVGLLAFRLSQTLQPGLRALELLGRTVPNHADLDAGAIAFYDALMHRATQSATLRDRISHLIPSATKAD